MTRSLHRPFALGPNRPLTRLLAPLLALVALLSVQGCGSSEPSAERRQDSAAETSPSAAAEAIAAGNAEASEPASEEILVVFLGDSLTAGYGLDEAQAYPALVGDALRAEGLPVRIVNAGISGDTTAGGLARLDWLLRQEPDILVVALGGNDGLRGTDLGQTEANLRQILERATAAGARVLLAGMMLPPNYGDYANQFNALYARLAESGQVDYLPFLLEGVGGVRELNQPDGIHPTAEGQEKIAALVLQTLRPLVEAERAEAR